MSNSSSSSGVSLLTVVGIVFVILKLVGTINWSWWWVLAPFWLGLIFWVIMVLGFIGVAFYFGAYEQYQLQKSIKRNKK